jgi:hypothetical protein
VSSGYEGLQAKLAQVAMSRQANASIPAAERLLMRSDSVVSVSSKLAMALAGDADYLVTGDHRAGLLQRGRFGRTRIVTPGAFCAESKKPAYN